MIDFRSMGVGIRHSTLQCLRWAIACSIRRVPNIFGVVLLSAQGALSERVCCKPLSRKNKNSKAEFWDTCEQQHDNEMSKRCITRVGSHDFYCKASFVGHACAL